MTRAEFQRLAEVRIAEATDLLKLGHGSGAYYLGGYAVECVLKACIAARIPAFEFPDRKFVEQIWTHDIVKLSRAAALEAELETKLRASSSFADNWSIVTAWTEASRYRMLQPAAAEELLRAIIEIPDGVMSWLRIHW